MGLIKANNACWAFFISAMGFIADGILQRVHPIRTHIGDQMWRNGGWRSACGVPAAMGQKVDTNSGTKALEDLVNCISHDLELRIRWMPRS